MVRMVRMVRSLADRTFQLCERRPVVGAEKATPGAVEDERTRGIEVPVEERRSGILDVEVYLDQLNKVVLEGPAKSVFVEGRRELKNSFGLRPEVRGVVDPDRRRPSVLAIHARPERTALLQDVDGDPPQPLLLPDLAEAADCLSCTSSNWAIGLAKLGKLAMFYKILQIFSGLVLGCIKTKFCKKICV